MEKCERCRGLNYIIRPFFVYHPVSDKYVYCPNCQPKIGNQLYTPLTDIDKLKFNAP